MKVPVSAMDAPAPPKGVRAFLAWWTRELAAMVPLALRDRPAYRGGVLLVAMGENAATILLRRRGTWREIGSVDLSGADAAREGAEFGRLLATVRRGRTPVALRLPGGRGFRRVAEYPLSAERDLDAILTHQMDRLTPFTAGQVYFDYRVLERDSRAGRLRVELVAAPRGIVDDALARLGDWNMTADFVDVGEAGDESCGAINLLGHGRAARKVRAGRWRNGALALVNAALIAAVVALPLSERMRTEADMTRQVAAAKIGADKVMGLRDAVERIKVETAILKNKRKETPRAIAVINEITRILPDGTWLDELSLREGVVQVQGFSPQASALIATIEGSAMLTDTRFRAPVTQQASLGVERFHISAGVLWGKEQ